MRQKFSKKGQIREVFVKDRVITLITPEMSYHPLTLDINKAARHQDARMTELLKSVGITDFEKYVDDESIMKDIIEDFKESGWGCIK